MATFDIYVIFYFFLIQCYLFVKYGGGQPHIGVQQDELKLRDKIHKLPGQPKGVNFNHYSGYVEVDSTGNKALFYYFAESPESSSSKPLVLWLQGGPGCSSFGQGALGENGPFRIKSDAKSLTLNPHAWNKVANMLYLETPAGVGFSYGDSLTIYSQTGDISTAKDNYAFLVNWLERFPEYKNRPVYLTGESYAGHFVPQLAQTILFHNRMGNNATFINLKGIALGNAVIDDASTYAGIIDFLWSHAFISDETHALVHKYCNFSEIFSSENCTYYYVKKAKEEMGSINVFDIYDRQLCCLVNNTFKPTKRLPSSVKDFDPCTYNYVQRYLNLNNDVRKALHSKNIFETNWTLCNSVFQWLDSPSTILPVIRELISSNIRICLFSGDVDARVPVTATKYSINALKLPVKSAWRPWRSQNNEPGGYVVEYEGLLFATVRDAGHQVASYQPERALTLFSSFLQGTPLPYQFFGDFCS